MSEKLYRIKPLAFEERPHASYAKTPLGDYFVAAKVWTFSPRGQYAEPHECKGRKAGKVEANADFRARVEQMLEEVPDAK